MWTLLGKKFTLGNSSAEGKWLMFSWRFLPSTFPALGFWFKWLSFTYTKSLPYNSPKLTCFKPLKSAAAAAAAKSLQLCLTLCNPIDGSPPGSPIPGILQARTLEWIAISFSNAWKWKVKGKSLSRVRLLAIPWTAAYQAPLSTGLSRQECWSGVPSPSL